jgi:hypothetical protein
MQKSVFVKLVSLSSILVEGKEYIIYQLSDVYQGTLSQTKDKNISETSSENKNQGLTRLNITIKHY